MIYFIAVDAVCPTHMLAPLLQLSENFFLQEMELHKNLGFNGKSGNQHYILISLISFLWKEQL